MSSKKNQQIFSVIQEVQEPKKLAKRALKPKQEQNKEKKKTEKNETKPKKISQDCDICAETLNKDKVISCPYCSFECCKKCVETFLLGIDDDVPRCMSSNCKKVWSLTFIATNFTKIFYNKHYRDRRSFLLLEREKSRLPEAQIVLEQRKRRELLYKEIYDTEKDIYEFFLLKKASETKEKKKEIAEIIRQYREKIMYIYIQIDNPVAVKENKQVIMKCPVNDCRGFINNENEEGINKCGVCDVVVCKKCRVVKKRDEHGNEHQCNPDVLATIKMLAKDTRNCPNCSTPIFKINGCDQMYCTQCHTAFSWIRGTIEKGIIHNPHFYEYQRRMNNGVAPRVPGDVVDDCNAVPQWVIINQFLDNSYNSNIITHAHAMIGHIETVIHHLYTLETLDLRVDYLDNKLDETKWLDNLKKRQKKAEKDEEVRQILRMVVTIFSDLFRTFCEKSRQNIFRHLTNTNEYIEKTANNIDKVCIYANDALSVIEKQYNNIVPYFGKNCIMYQSYKNCSKEYHR
jgi:hypothetical protein